MFDDPAMLPAMRTYLWETAPVLALFLDANLCVVEVNAQASRVLCPTVLGRPLVEQFVFLPPALDLPALIRQGGAATRLTISTAAGVPETVDFQFFPAGAGTLVLGSFDLQEQQELRREVLALNQEANNLGRQLAQANAELRELNQLKNQFLGMAAHDLRAPAGLIITYSEFLLDEAGKTLSEEHREFLRVCLSSALGMKRLIENFLDVSVIESGKLRLELAPAGVPEILAGVEPIVRLRAGRKKISLLVDLPDEATASSVAARRLRVDAPKLQQVLLNLLNNAVEHSQPGGHVWLSVRWTESELIFAVRDEGPGLTPADQARLFTAFAQAGTRKTAGERSVGLGLAIARMVIAAHGGRLWVESFPGQGATFLFALPLPLQPLHQKTHSHERKDHLEP